MLGKICGILLLVAGGIVAFGVLAGLVGVALGLLWLVIKLVVPFLLIYVGYRLLTRNRDVIAY